MKVKPLQWDSTVEFGRGEILTWNFWLLSGGCPYCVCLAVSIVTDRENNHTGSKETPSKQGKAYFIQQQQQQILLKIGNITNYITPPPPQENSL